MAGISARRAGFPGGRRRRRWTSRLGEHPEQDGLERELFWPVESDRVLWQARDDEQAIAWCDGVIDLVGAFFNVPTLELRRTGRAGQQIAQVRQIAMYVAHVTLRLSMKQVGTGFMRDRTTVLHACHMVEDMRDEIAFDRVVARVERVVAAAFEVRGAR